MSQCAQASMFSAFLAFQAGELAHVIWGNTETGVAVFVIGLIALMVLGGIIGSSVKEE